MPLERDCREIMLYSILKSMRGGPSTDLDSTGIMHTTVSAKNQLPLIFSILIICAFIMYVTLHFK